MPPPPHTHKAKGGEALSTGLAYGQHPVQGLAFAVSSTWNTLLQKDLFPSLPHFPSLVRFSPQWLLLSNISVSLTVLSYLSPVSAKQERGSMRTAMSVLCLLLNPQNLEQCVVHNRCSINTK